MGGSHRGTIFVEDGEILEHEAFDGDQFILTVRLPRLAAAASPGAFAHIRCDRALRLRRPMSVMLTDAATGWAQFLYKAVGSGTRLLSEKRPGERLSVIGPIGRGFDLQSIGQRPLLLGGGVGIPPMVFIAAELKATRPGCAPLVLMGSEVPFPFDAKPSQILVPGIPEGVIASMPLMEDFGFASRLASLQGFAGCFDGFITDLAREWLNSLEPSTLREVTILACGPTPMLRATAALAAEYGIRSQLSLEEYMACGVGGCAGCAVAIEVDGQLAMRRVCVDGPVFDGAAIRWL